ncbi:TRAF-type zinc finger-related [Raphanus sativus]|uniref:Uncharacterized protein LOC108856682 n=1 Tax=Raphanus sativus TaxID=3726 RepID=A0A6J0NN07_RAPSA|nr:uncharacterized protein LOC108856682 [Raphanus sativus]KAJ4895535.1 TRAF-type zinc finger-related [Raphanus sativus]
MASENGEITIVCDHCERDIPSPNMDLHRVHCARNLEKCNICGDMVPRKHTEEHLLNTHAPAVEWILNTRAAQGDGNGRRRRDVNGVSNKRLFFTVVVTGIAVLMGSLFFQRKR